MRIPSLELDGVEVCAAAAKDVLAAGGLVAGPTDTVYGIFSAWKSEEALQKLYDIKGRDSDKKLLALADSESMIAPLVASPPPAELSRHWPGALTLVLPAREHPFGWDSIAFRVPACDFARLLAKALGEPIYAPSANPQGSPPARTCGEATAYFGGAIDLYIDGGDAKDTQASTLVSCLEIPPKVLRQGSVRV